MTSAGSAPTATTEAAFDTDTVSAKTRTASKEASKAGTRQETPDAADAEDAQSETVEDFPYYQWPTCVPYEPFLGRSDISPGRMVYSFDDQLYSSSQRFGPCTLQQYDLRCEAFKATVALFVKPFEEWERFEQKRTFAKWDRWLKEVQRKSFVTGIYGIELRPFTMKEVYDEVKEKAERAKGMAERLQGGRKEGGADVRERGEEVMEKMEQGSVGAGTNSSDAGLNDSGPRKRRLTTVPSPSTETWRLKPDTLLQVPGKERPASLVW